MASPLPNTQLVRITIVDWGEVVTFRDSLFTRSLPNPPKYWGLDELCGGTHSPALVPLTLSITIETDAWHLKNNTMVIRLERV